MIKPKLIVLDGFAAAGKTTIAKKYIAEHSMAMSLEADAIVDCIGDWANHEVEVRQITFDLIKAMLPVYLSSGRDVVLPYLVTSTDEFEAFEAIAHSSGADYYEFILHNDRADATKRLLERGKWGEETSPSLTEADLPNIEKLLTRMESALQNRPRVIKIDLKGQDPATTYGQILRYIAD